MTLLVATEDSAYWVREARKSDPKSVMVLVGPNVTHAAVSRAGADFGIVADDPTDALKTIISELEYPLTSWSRLPEIISGLVAEPGITGMYDS